MYRNRFDEAAYEPDYYEEDALTERMEEEIDPDYIPTDKEVREHAIHVLGMSLPEDQPFLSLAKEGLLAPLPPSWEIFRNRQGECYYKHKITQETTVDHPTDIQYRNKYQQMKQKMARNSLKLLGPKPTVGSLQGLSGSHFSKPQPLSIQSSLNQIGQPVGLSSMSGIKTNLAIDPDLEADLEDQLSEHEARAKTEWIQFEQQAKARHTKRMDQLKNNFDDNLAKIYQMKSAGPTLEERRQSLIEKLAAIHQRDSEVALSRFQSEQKQRLSQYRQLCEEDNNLKLLKHRQTKQEQLEKKQQQCDQAIAWAQDQQVKFRHNLEKSKFAIKVSMDESDNEEVQELMQKERDAQLADLVRLLQKEYDERKIQLDSQFQQVRKVLGFDPQEQLMQLQQKKGLLKQLLVNKVATMKAQQFSKTEGANATEFLKKSTTLRQTLQDQFNLAYTEALKQQQHIAQEQRVSIKSNYQLRLQQGKEAIASRIQSELYHLTEQSNRKLSALRQGFIDKVSAKVGNPEQVQLQLELQDKQAEVQNKELLVSNLQQQLELQTRILKEIKFEEELARCAGNAAAIESVFKRHLKDNGIEYRSEEYESMKAQYDQFKAKLNKDKKMLSGILTRIQSLSATMTNRYGTHTQLIRQYNSDVRRVRDNEDTLHKAQALLLRAENGDKEAMQALKTSLNYQEIQLKSLLNTESAAMMDTPSYCAPPKESTTQAKLKEQSKFLSGMKSELNRKLCAVRSMMISSSYAV